MPDFSLDDDNYRLGQIWLNEDQNTEQMDWAVHPKHSFDHYHQHFCDRGLSDVSDVQSLVKTGLYAACVLVMCVFG